MVTAFAYDKLDRVWKTTIPKGDEFVSVFDRNGKVTQEKTRFKLANGTYSERVTQRYTYDAADRVKTITTDDDTPTNLADNPVERVDGNGHVTTTFDALNRPKLITSAEGRQTEMRYDVNSNLTCLIDANGKSGKQPLNAKCCTEYREYDQLNRLTYLLTMLVT